MNLAPVSVEDWREFTLTRGPRMAAEAFLLKLAELSPTEQRAALCGLPDTRSLTQRFENAWPRRDSALGGVPFLTKDLYFRTGHPTFAGSTFLPEEIGLPRANSSLPTAFQDDAGAVECGRTQLNEFAFGLSGENPHCGDCPHPHDASLLSGGSSSGSAFAVARNRCRSAVRAADWSGFGLEVTRISMSRVPTSIISSVRPRCTVASMSWSTTPGRVEGSLDSRSAR